MTLPKLQDKSKIALLLLLTVADTPTSDSVEPLHGEMNEKAISSS